MLKDILEQIDDPFKREGFLKELIQMYLKSESTGDLYRKIITYHGDKESSELSNEVYELDEYPGVMRDSASDTDWIILNYFEKIVEGKHRIYINPPKSEVHNILKYYIEECDKRNVPYKLKYAVKREFQRDDQLLILSSTENLEEQIQILREFAKKHPEIVEKCGTPQVLTGKLDGWLGIADEAPNKYDSFAQCRLGALSESTISYVFEHPEIIQRCEDEETRTKVQEVIAEWSEKYIAKKDDVVSSLHYEPGFINRIKKVILDEAQQNPNIIEGVIAEYLKKCEEKGLDKDNLIFNKGTIENFMNLDNLPNKIELNDEIVSLMKEANSTILANMIAEKDSAAFSLKSRVLMRKLLMQKNIEERLIEQKMISDVEKLGENGIIDKKLSDRFDLAYNGERIYSYFNQIGHKTIPQTDSDTVENRKHEISEYFMKRVEHIRNNLEEIEKRIAYCDSNNEFLFEEMYMLEGDIENIDEKEELAKNLYNSLSLDTKDIKSSELEMEEI